MEQSCLLPKGTHLPITTEPTMTHWTPLMPSPPLILPSGSGQIECTELQQNKDNDKENYWLTVGSYAEGKYALLSA